MLLYRAALERLGEPSIRSGVKVIVAFPKKDETFDVVEKRFEKLAHLPAGL
jgi:hypothetical protein